MVSKHRFVSYDVFVSAILETVKIRIFANMAYISSFFVSDKIQMLCFALALACAWLVKCCVVVEPSPRVEARALRQLQITL